MFTGNKLVVLMPMLMMVFLFVGGSFYIKQATVVTNEKLGEEIEWETEFIKTENGTLLEASWNWTTSPDDGLQGDDFIGVTIMDDHGDPISPESITTIELMLESNEGHLKKEGQIVENGVLFSFPNEVQENEILGSKGSLKVAVHDDSTPQQAVISYLHTWEEHDGLQTQDARFFESGFVGKEKSDESFFWVMEQFVEIEKGMH